MKLLREQVTNLIILIILILGVVLIPNTRGYPQRQEQDCRSRRTIIVNASGGGDYTHIQWAIDNASEGDTVYVEAGLYVETGVYVESVLINKAISLIGAGRTNTTIDGKGEDSVIRITADCVYITGFNITNGSTGIKIDNSNYCRIENNTIFSNNRYGICVDHSENNSIVDNICTSNGRTGIELFLSSNNDVINNICDTNNWYGLDIGYSHGNNIKNNSCDSNKRDGILIQNANSNNLTNNTASMNEGIGIYLGGPGGSGSDQNIISNNIFNLNTLHGISINDSSSGNILTNNTCNSNSLYGIEIRFLPNNNLVHHNNFIFNNNNGTQASDDGNNNDWDDGNEGNYWSNWTSPDMNENGIVDKPYNLSGNANAQDHFPLVNPISKLLIIADAGNDVTIDKNQTVIFDGSESWGYPSITNYTWTFNYNSIPIFLYGITPSFTFEIPGTYLITLTVKNESGNSDTDQMIVYVRDVDPPIDVERPLADAGSDNTIHQGETFIFNGNKSSDNVGIINYTWNFTYNSNIVLLYGVSPNFTFHIPSIHRVTLNVSDDRGNWATDVMNLTVRDSTWPVAEAGADIIIDQHETAYFNASKSSDNVGIVNYTWHFISGQNEIFLYGITVAFTFNVVGNYGVTLNVTDGEGHWAVDTLNVTVNDITPPVADAGQNMNISKGDIVSYNASSSYDNVAIVNYTWTLIYDNESQIMFGPAPRFTFEIPGDYFITLHVEDAMGLWDEDDVRVRVIDTEKPINNISPVAKAGNDLTVNIDTFVRFNGSNSWDDTRIVNYTWQFIYNDSLITLFGPDPTFKFDIPGNYTVTLRVLDAGGNFNDDTIIITVKEKEGDVPDDDFPPENVQENEKGAGISLWIWLILMVCIFTIIIVLIYFMWNRTEDKVEQSLEDEFERVKESDESDSE